MRERKIDTQGQKLFTEVLVDIIKTVIAKIIIKCIQSVYRMFCDYNKQQNRVVSVVAVFFVFSSQGTEFSSSYL